MFFFFFYRFSLPSLHEGYEGQRFDSSNVLHSSDVFFVRILRLVHLQRNRPDQRLMVGYELDGAPGRYFIQLRPYSYHAGVAAREGARDESRDRRLDSESYRRHALLLRWDFGSYGDQQRSSKLLGL